MTGPLDMRARRADLMGASGVLDAVATLLAQALSSEDAEVGGLHADDVLLDPAGAYTWLAGPDAWPSARFAVVQRYGRVGAFLVVAYECRWRAQCGGSPPLSAPLLDRLLDEFWVLGTEEIYGLVETIDLIEGDERSDDHLSAHRWLHAAYATAGRDGTDKAHRTYMEALDRVMRSTRSVLAS